MADQKERPRLVATFRLSCTVIASYAVKHGGFGKSAPDFLFVFHCDFSSIAHRFRVICIYFYTGNDIIIV